jgi:hypothetical protein
MRPFWQGFWKVILTFVTALAVLAVIGAASARAAAPPTVVTNVQPVATWLNLAEAYWHVADPVDYASIRCPGGLVQVVVETLVPATGDNGVLPASQVGAETTLNGCIIALAPSEYKLYTSPHKWSLRGHQQDPKYVSYYTCTEIAHEFGHVVGFPDSKTVPVMNTNGTKNDDPLCAEYVYHWAHISVADRAWLNASGLLAPGRHWL